MKIYERWFKRAFDITFSVMACILLSPLFCLIFALVALGSHGPVIFRQKRVGLEGVPFTMFKFRTMVVDAPDLRNCDGTTFNGLDDPRVTSVGRLLRSTSLDELPQLANVLRGEMSIVGGRPDLPEGVLTYRPHQLDRLKVRPGLTSWAMLHGRNNVPFDRRRDLDAWYANNVSLMLDLRIILHTIKIVLLREGVYNDYSRHAPATHSETTRDLASNASELPSNRERRKQ